jgi:hypothetical protein
MTLTTAKIVMLRLREFFLTAVGSGPGASVSVLSGSISRVPIKDLLFLK